ncbi:MAG: hypothetical protein LBB55_00250 [Zoogloeaceae bacterium]|jgi:hypothetical protein|nr:hypothetical protein [Zoogloeaceae bacterium]
MAKNNFRPVEIPELGMNEIVNLFPSIGNLIWQVMRAFPAFVGQETGDRGQSARFVVCGSVVSWRSVL